MGYNLLVKKQTDDSWFELDMREDTPMGVVFNVSDVREPQSIKSNYTKNFTIPATKNNRKFFQGLTENGFSIHEFNPAKKTLCELLLDNNPIMVGYLQVASIIRDDRANIQEFEVVIYGELSSFFSRIDKVKFDSIDLSEYNHNLTAENIRNSWSNFIYEGGTAYRHEVGQGYVYPMEFRGRGLTNGKEVWEEVDWRPSIYVKTIWDKIFKKAGMTYTSKFLNTDRFKRLILPFTNGETLTLSADQVKYNEWRAVRSSDQTNPAYRLQLQATVAGKSAQKNIFFDSVVDSPSGAMNGLSFMPKQTKEGTVFVDIDIDVWMNVPSLGAGMVAVLLSDKDATNKWPLKFQLYNNTKKKVVWEKTEYYTYTPGNYLGPNNNLGVQKFMLEIPLLAVKNNEYLLKWETEQLAGKFQSKIYNLSSQPLGGTFNFFYKTNSRIYFTLKNNIVSADDPIILNQVLPQDKLLSDFMVDINKMFNLFWKVNPDKENDFIIEPRDDMYNDPSNKLLDWTKKVDRDVDIVINPLEEVNNAMYKFTYSEDDDYLNDSYTGIYNEVYGERTVSSNNDFKTETYETKISFTPAVLSNVYNNKVVSAYYSVDEGVIKPIDAGLKILYWGGFISFNPTNPAEEWYLYKDGGVFDNYSSYPYAGHFDNPYNPTFDLNFGICKQYYTKTDTFTPNNLFNLYWFNTINDIISPEAHLLECEAHLTPYDILNFNLFDIIQIDESYYRVNKLEYDIFKERAKIELYKTTYTPLQYNGLPQPSTIPPVVVPPKPPTPPNPPYPGPTPPVWEPNPGSINWDVVTWRDAEFGWNNRNAWNYRNFDSDVINGRNVVAWSKVDREYNDFQFSRTQYNDSYIISDLNNNSYPTNRNVSIRGQYNYIAQDAYNVNLVGDNNTIGAGSTNVRITGNNNRVVSNVTNVDVKGDNNYVSVSNATYDNGIAYVNHKPNYSGTVLRGGVNTVGNPFSSVPPVVRGGIDAVENFGGCKDIQVIRGGSNNVQFRDY